jgi:predicted Zn-dependent protease
MNKYYKDIIIFGLVLLISIGVSAGIYFIFKNNYKKTESKIEGFQLKIESQLKEMIKNNIDIKSKTIKNTVVNDSVEIVKNRLVNYLDDNPYDIEIIVVDSPVINAATFPGGLIIVYSGLLKIMDSPEELAAVLAHEIAHVVYKDPYEASIRQFGLSVLSQIVTKGNSGDINDLILNLVNNSFSREQESRADRFALDLMIKAKLSPKHLSDIFKKLKAEEKIIIDKNILKYISTHPDIDKRIEEADKKAKSFNSKEKPIDVDWDKVKKNLPTLFN